MPSDAVLDSIDESLGPRSGRFFGEGFKRVSHALTNLRVTPGSDGLGRVDARAELTYPEHWSTKASGPLRPHLSAVDALVLAAELVEVHLVTTYAMAPEGLGRAWLRRVDLRGGTLPQEQLHAFPATAVRTAVRSVPSSFCASVSTFSARVGTLRVSLEVEHDSAPVSDPRAWYPTAEHALGPAPQRYFGAGYQGRTTTIRDVAIDLDRHSATGLVRVAADGNGVDVGLGGAYAPALTMVDAFVAFAQLGQAFAYRLDGLERSRSNNMWMRRLVMECPTPYQSLSHPFVATAAASRVRLVTLGGRVWRTLDGTGEVRGIACRGSFAHELPGDGPTAATVPQPR